MVTPDRRFKWEGRVAFDLDLIAYRRGRLNFTGVYDAVLGDERREFDLNHGNYVFEMSASRRVQSVELAAVIVVRLAGPERPGGAQALGQLQRIVIRPEMHEE